MVDLDERDPGRCRKDRLSFPGDTERRFRPDDRSEPFDRRDGDFEDRLRLGDFERLWLDDFLWLGDLDRLWLDDFLWLGDLERL